MKHYLKSIWREITSKDNWKQVYEMMGFTSPRIIITKEKYIPFIFTVLIVIVSFTIIYIVLYAFEELIKSAAK